MRGSIINDRLQMLHTSVHGLPARCGFGQSRAISRLKKAGALFRVTRGEVFRSPTNRNGGIEDFMDLLLKKYLCGHN
jgi:hypothetical protein